MALYIVTRDDNEGVQWHIGQKSPISVGGGKSIKIEDVTEVQADGDELYHIQKMFSSNYFRHSEDVRYSIPMPLNRKVVNWYGDLAKLIVGNL